MNSTWGEIIAFIQVVGMVTWKRLEVRDSEDFLSIWSKKCVEIEMCSSSDSLALLYLRLTSL